MGADGSRGIRAPEPWTDGFSASQTESNNGYPSLFRATVTVEGRVKFGVRCRATVPSLAGLQGRLAIVRVYIYIYIY